MGSNGLLMIQLNPITYQVKGGEIDAVVDIFNKKCSCKVFDIDILPCAHAIAAALHARVGVYSLVSPYYTKEYYMLAYQHTIYPVGSQSQWDVPDEVTSRVVLPREVKDKKRGRLKNSRYPSAGEFRNHKNRCGKCGQLGHYKKKCRSEAGSTEGKPPTNVTAL
ncbi:hypothetical protein UlMin_001127 [Ulmus minor]